MGILHHDCCTIVDESDGTIIDDDDVLMELKDKTFILLESADNWTPPTQSESCRANIDIDTSPTSAISPTDESAKKPSCRIKTREGSKMVDYFEFRNELQSLNLSDLDHLTTVARSLLSLNIPEDRWNFLWTYQSFLDFINYCEEHPLAEMHVVKLLRHNETAQKTAPESVLAKFSIKRKESSTDVDLPKLLNSLSEAKEFLQRIAESGNVPKQVLQVLASSMSGNEQFEREMTAANAVIHWSSARRTFESPWCIETVNQCLSNINHYENRPTAKPRLRASLKNRNDSASTCATATEAAPQLATGSSVSRPIDNLGVGQYGSDDKLTDVELQSHSKKHSQTVQRPSDTDNSAASIPTTRHIAPEFQNTQTTGALRQSTVSSLLYNQRDTVGILHNQCDYADA